MNHNAVLEHVGIEPVDYAYYDNASKSFDFAGFVDAVETVPERSVFLLHACAHNPTGFDPSPDQWKVLAEIFCASVPSPSSLRAALAADSGSLHLVPPASTDRRSHFAFWDSAYQGFTSGSLETDRLSVRHRYCSVLLPPSVAADRDVPPSFAAPSTSSRTARRAPSRVSSPSPSRRTAACTANASAACTCSARVPSRRRPSSRSSRR